MYDADFAYFDPSRCLVCSTKLNNHPTDILLEEDYICDRCCTHGKIPGNIYSDNLINILATAGHAYAYYKEYKIVL